MTEANRSAPFGELVPRAERVLASFAPLDAVVAVEHEAGTYPRFAERADAARFWDSAGAEYLDWSLGFGAVALGHRHPTVQAAVREQLERGAHVSLPSPLEVEVAEQIVRLVPCAEQVAFGKNGTDVTSAAVRLARAITSRDGVITCGYHGFQDWSLAVEPACRGIPLATRELVEPFAFNDLNTAHRLVEEYPGRIAAIVVDPVQDRMPDEDFLGGLRCLADEQGCLLVFDEVVTGFRVARGGAQEALGVTPDLACFGKALANGMPLSALAGPRSLMQHLPGTWFGMTCRRETLSLAAARATLDVLEQVDVSGHLASIGEQLRIRFREAAQNNGLDWELTGHPTRLWMRTAAAGRLTPVGARTLFLERCRRRGVFLQSCVLPCLAHSTEDIDRTAEVFGGAMAIVGRAAERGLDGLLDSPIRPGMERLRPRA